jgi:uncharacterized protein involved in outer membrane biogenesis
MPKWIFIVGGILLVIVIAAVVAVLNINSYVQRNREYLVQQAERAVGRKIDVQNIEVNLWNGIGVRFESFRLADDPAFSSDPFVQAKSLQANVRLLPLLRKDVQVKRLILHQPGINIIRNRQGIYNFASLGGPDKKKDTETKKDTATEDARDKAARQRAALLIALVEISGGVARYRDLGDGTDLAVQQLDLRAQDLNFDRPISINVAAAVLASKQNVNLRLLIGPISPESEYRNVALDSQLDIDPLDLNQLKKAVPKIFTALPKDLEVGGIFKLSGLKIKGTLHEFALNGGIEGTQGFIQWGDYFHKPAGIPLVLESTAHYSKDKIAIRNAGLKLHTLPLQVKGDIALGKPTVINVSLDSDQTSLEGWGKLIPAVANYDLNGKMGLRATVRGPIGAGKNPQVDGNLSLQSASIKVPQLPKAIENLNGQVKFSDARAETKETNFNLGNSRISLAAVIERFSPLTLSYKLSTAELALADIQPSLPPERSSDVLRDLGSDGQVTTANGQSTVAGKILSSDGRLFNMDYKNLDANLSYAKNNVVLRSFRANLLNGSAQLKGEFGFNESPKFSMASEIKGIDLVQLHQYFTKDQPDMRGSLNGNLKLSGQGDQWQEIRPTLRGDGQTEVLKGTLLNFNIADAVLSGATGIPGLTNLINPAIRRKYPETFEAKDTVFKDLQTQLDIGDSRLNLKNLRIAAAQFRVAGDGWVDFERRVDFRGVIRFSPELSGDIAGAVREIRLLFNKNNELEIPFTLSGQMPNVKPRPDASFLTKALQRGLFQRGAEELQEQLFGPKERRAPDRQPDQERQPSPKSPEDLLRRGLEGLFGRQKRQ